MPDESARDPEIVTGPPAEADGQEFIQQPAKLMRIAHMIKELLAEVRQAPLDDAGRKRLHQIHERAIAVLRETLSEELQQELSTLAMPLASDASQGEIRVAQAQLVGWLEGLFQGIQAALFAQSMQARAQLEEMRRRGLPAAAGPGPGQYL
ncbi:MAG TPA: proteasome activator [Terriglobales bacterium]|nr:proteasome activator [Terriglobales bacterium]